MKIFAWICLALVGVALCACKKEADLSPDKMYYFYQTTCGHCHQAAKYIEKKYPTLQMEKFDITTDKTGYNMFLKCAQKFKLGQEVGTPLFCMGDKYVMGWGVENIKKFDMYVPKFIK